MTITRNQFRQAVINAEKLGNTRDASTIRDLAASLKRWGKLTPRQENFAKVLVKRNSDEMVEAANIAQGAHEIRWSEDEDYREWILFLAHFFGGSSQAAYRGHIDNRRRTASMLLKFHIDGVVPNSAYCEPLLTSKLAPRLRDTFEKPLLYAVGELVHIRRTELNYYQLEQGKDKEIGIVTGVNAKYVDTVGTYSKSKGGTRYYRVLFPAGEKILQEQQIKLVSRKAR